MGTTRKDSTVQIDPRIRKKIPPATNAELRKWEAHINAVAAVGPSWKEKIRRIKFKYPGDLRTVYTEVCHEVKVEKARRREREAKKARKSDHADRAPNQSSSVYRDFDQSMDVDVIPSSVHSSLSSASRRPSEIESHPSAKSSSSMNSRASLNQMQLDQANSRGKPAAFDTAVAGWDDGVCWDGADETPLPLVQEADTAHTTRETSEELPVPGHVQSKAIAVVNKRFFPGMGGKTLPISLAASSGGSRDSSKSSWSDEDFRAALRGAAQAEQFEADYSQSSIVDFGGLTREMKNVVGAGNATEHGQTISAGDLAGSKPALQYDATGRGMPVEGDAAAAVESALRTGPTLSQQAQCASKLFGSADGATVAEAVFNTAFDSDGHPYSLPPARHQDSALQLVDGGLTVCPAAIFSKQDNARGLHAAVESVRESEGIMKYASLPDDEDDKAQRQQQGAITESARHIETEPLRAKQSQNSSTPPSMVQNVMCENVIATKDEAFDGPSPTCHTASVSAVEMEACKIQGASILDPAPIDKNEGNASTLQSGGGQTSLVAPLTVVKPKDRPVGSLSMDKSIAAAFEADGWELVSDIVESGIGSTEIAGIIDEMVQEKRILRGPARGAKLRLKEAMKAYEDAKEGSG